MADEGIVIPVRVEYEEDPIKRAQADLDAFQKRLNNMSGDNILGIDKSVGALDGSLKKLTNTTNSNTGAVTGNEKAVDLLVGTMTRYTGGAHGARSAASYFAKNLAGVSSTALVAGAAVIGVGAAVFAAGKFALKSAQEYQQFALSMKDAAEKTSLNVEDYSRLVEAGTSVRVTQEQITSALTTAKKNGWEPTYEWLGKVANEMAKAKTETDKLGIATRYFGESAAPGMVKMLGEGSDAFQNYLDNVENGLVVTEEGAKAAEAYALATQKLKDKWQAFKMSVGAPILIQIVETVTRVTKYSDLGLTAAQAAAARKAERAYEGTTAVSRGGKGGSRAADVEAGLSTLVFSLREAGIAFEDIDAIIADHLALLNNGSLTYTEWAQKIHEAQLAAEDAAKVKPFEPSMQTVEFAIKGNIGAMFEQANPTIEQYIKNVEYYNWLETDGERVLEEKRVALIELMKAERDDSDTVKAAIKDYENFAKQVQFSAGGAELYTEKLGDLTLAMKAQISEQVYGLALKSEDAQAMYDMANALGQVSDEDYAIASAVQTINELYDANNDKMIDAAGFAGIYAEKLSLINDAVMWLQENDKPITLEAILDFITKYTTIGTPPEIPGYSNMTINFSVNAAGYGNAKALARGGAMGDGWKEVGEQGSEGISPEGYVIPHPIWQAMKSAGKLGTKHFALGNLPQPMDDVINPYVPKKPVYQPFSFIPPTSTTPSSSAPTVTEAEINQAVQTATEAVTAASNATTAVSQAASSIAESSVATTIATQQGTRATIQGDQNLMIELRGLRSDIKNILPRAIQEAYQRTIGD